VKFQRCRPGRWADAGHTRVATLAALVVGAMCFLPVLVLPSLGIIGLVVTGVVLDFCVQTNMVLGQREIYALDPAIRNRLNALYMTSIFVGGAAGSAMASVLYEHGGWMWVSAIGSVFPLVALVHFLVRDMAGVKGRVGI
jgi:predicted MFS family arabinose efflux permease